MGEEMAQNQTVKEEDAKIPTVQYKEIGNTKFKIVSYYSGTETYIDIVKSVLRTEIERT